MRKLALGAALTVCIAMAAETVPVVSAQESTAPSVVTPVEDATKDADAGTQPAPESDENSGSGLSEDGVSSGNKPGDAIDPDTPTADATVENTPLADRMRAAAASAQPSVITANPPAPIVHEFNDEKWRDKIKYYSGAIDNQGRPRVMEFAATSPSMNNRTIPLAVIRAKEPNRPILYLLNGAGGGEQSTTWLSYNETINFYLDKNINVVIPMRGAFSYYVDWAEDVDGTEYIKGPQRWETFLTQELPKPLESHDLIQANDKRGIAGLSMSATSSLLLAARNPGFYNAVGSFSGCAATSKTLPSLFTKFTLDRDGISPQNVFGPKGSQRAIEHDALIQAEGLRGSQIYVSNGSGLISDRETLNGLIKNEAEEASLAAFTTSSDIAVVGGLIEAGTNACTHDLRVKLNRLDIPADFKFRNVGVHTWYYWVNDMKDSWPTFARGFGIEGESD